MTELEDDARRRIRKVAGWLVIQGSLELVTGLIVGAGWASMLGKARGEFGGFQSAAFLGMAICAVMGGILKVAAGRRNRECKALGLGTAALWSSVLSLPPCYCFPTSAILLVYGLRVYSDPAVQRVFST